jgi:preprotein translocase subunit SecE
MNDIEIDEIIVMSKESEFWCNLGTRDEYDCIFWSHSHELIQASITIVCTVRILSVSSTYFDSMMSFLSSMFPRLTRMSYPEVIMRIGSPIGYNMVISMSFSHSYGESFGFHFIPGYISYIICISISSDMRPIGSSLPDGSDSSSCSVTARSE